MKQLVANYWNSFSFVGLVFATLLFSASVTPSLLPRHYAVQGLLSGLSLAIGYGVGMAGLWFYLFLELPELAQPRQRIAKRIIVALVAVIIVTFLWQMTAWQNSVRVLMEMPQLETAYPIRVVGIAAVFGAILVGMGRLFGRCVVFVSQKLQRFVPPRIAHAIGFALVAFVALLLTNDVVVKRLLDSADQAFLRIDKIVDDDLDQPQDSVLTGSEASLVSWESIGRQGKIFLGKGPTQQEIAEFHGRDVQRPIRVYVGMRTKATMHERARLALEELKRVGGFEKSVLIVATPTGTGWLDPSAVDTVEYLHRGDTAIVSMQYSYLPSWITILVDPQRSIRSATILFEEVYGYWKTLPPESRPRLYLHGLSLGSLGSEVSADLYTIFEDPIDGAVWSGPPFPSKNWNHIVANRNEGTPVWLPEFRDQRLVRFTTQKNALKSGAPWGPIRAVYLQHASDPMIWFSPDLAWSSPAWLQEPRGPDVSPDLRWYPVLTFLQIACDLPMATAVPLGYGHNYAPSSYIDAWIAVTEPEHWTEQKTDDLKALFKKRETPKP
ncbi:MAG: alpha/beta-hydrolase family protein [Planctomycetaceae bacterium]|nr:alpha/beta-hydrolase family protein [Planctomycetaceae bacterium]